MMTFIGTGGAPTALFSSDAPLPPSPMGQRPTAASTASLFRSGGTRMEIQPGGVARFISDDGATPEPVGAPAPLVGSPLLGPPSRIEIQPGGVARFVSDDDPEVALAEPPAPGDPSVAVPKPAAPAASSPTSPAELHLAAVSSENLGDVKRYFCEFMFQLLAANEEISRIVKESEGRAEAADGRVAELESQVADLETKLAGVTAERDTLRAQVEKPKAPLRSSKATPAPVVEAAPVAAPEAPPPSPTVEIVADPDPEAAPAPVPGDSGPGETS